MELVVLLATGLAIVVGGVVAATFHLLTHPPRRTYATALSRGRPGDPSELPPGPGGPRPFTAWSFAVAGATLPVWDIAGDDPDGPIIVLSHGWGDSRIGGLSRVGALAPVASRLVLWDMPGHGDAPGACALGTREVGHLRHLLDAVGAERPVILYGWSLGAGVSIAAAAGWDGTPAAVAGVIAEAPYRRPETPAANVLRLYGLPSGPTLTVTLALLGLRLGVGARWDARGIFDRADLAALLHVPLLVMHGDQDAVCPVADGRAIAAARRGTPLVVEGGGHHGLWTEPEHAAACAAAVTAFVRSGPTIGACA